MPDERIGIIIDAVNQAQGAINSAQKGLAGLSSAAEGTNKSVAKLDGGMDALGSSLLKVGGILDVAVTIPLTLLGKSMISQVSNIEQYRVAFDTMLGSVEEGGKMIKKVTEFARTTPFTIGDVVNSSKQLLAFNIQAEDLLPTLNALGNIAAGVGTDKLPQLILAFGQVKAATRLTGAELRQFTEAGVPLLELLGKQSGRTAGQVKDDMESGIAPSFEDVRKALFGLSEEGGKFANLMQKQSKTLGGVVSNLKDNFTRLALAVLGVTAEGEILAGGPFETLKKGAEFLLEMFEKLVAAFNNLSPTMRTIIVATAALVAVIGPIVTLLGGLVLTVGTFTAALGFMGVTVGAVVASLGSFLAIVALVVAAIGGLVFAVVKGTQAFNGWLDGITPDEKAVKDSFKKNLEDPIIGSVINATEGALTELDKLKAGLTNAFTTDASGGDFATGVAAQLQTVVDNTKSQLGTLQESRLADLESLKASNAITEEEYLRLKDTIVNSYDTAIAKQDEFVSSFTDMASSLSPTEETVRGIFEAQRTAALESLTGTKEDFDRITSAMNANQLELGNARLKTVIEQSETERDTSVANAEELYSQVLNVASAGLDDQTEYIDAAGQEQSQTVAGHSQDIIDIAKNERDETIKQAVEKQIGIIENAVAEAKAKNGVYDASNKQILTGSAAFWFKVKQLAIAGGRIVGVEVTSFLRNMGNVFSSAYQGILKASGNLWGKIKDGWEALKSGDLKGVISAAADALNPKDLAVDFASGFATSFSAQDKIIQSDLDSDLKGIVDSYNAAFGDVKFDQVYADALANSEALRDSLTKTGDEGGAANDNITDSANGAADAEKAAKEEIENLNAELKRLGVFSIKEGGKTVDTFDSAADGVKKINDRLANLPQRARDLAGSMDDLSLTILRDLVKGFSPTEDVITNFDDLEDAVKAVSKEVEDLAGDHQKFIDDAQKGLDDFNDKLQETIDKYAEMRKEAGESAAGDIASSLQQSMEDQADLTKQIAEAQSDLNDAQADWNAGTADSTDALDSAQEKLDELNAKLEETNANIAAFGTISADDLNKQLESVQNKLASTTISDADRATLQEQEYVLLGKQNIALEQQSALSQALADEKAKAHLSEIDYTAYELGKKLEAIETEKQAQIKSLQDLQTVQQAIVAGTIGELDTTGLSDDAQTLAQKAVAEQIAYETQLQAQLVLLQSYKDQEQSIYANTYAELQAQQATFQAYLEGSYAQIIVRLKEVAAAAREAFAAQQAVAGGGFSAGGFTGFARGGYTGQGAKDQVAGLVHKGEWVAPKWMVSKFMPMFRQLEGLRAGKTRGFAEGGFTSPSAPQYNQPITINGGSGSPTDLRQAGRYLAWLLRTS